MTCFLQQPNHSGGVKTDLDEVGLNDIVRLNDSPPQYPTTSVSQRQP